MAGLIVHVGATLTCPHSGQVTIVSSNTRVRVGTHAVATVDDTYTVAGCPFQVPGPKPQPCVEVQWTASTRVRVNGSAVVLQTTTGTCRSAEKIIQGAPNVVTTQTRVKGR